MGVGGWEKGGKEEGEGGRERFEIGARFETIEFQGEF